MTAAQWQQVAAGLEAVSNTWNFNAYALIPVGTNEYRLNSNYLGGALDTNGLDVGYAITPDFKASVGYYYQQGDLGATDSSGVLGRVFYNISNGLTAGHNLSYDQAFETRFSADLKYHFGSNGYGAPSAKKEWKSPVIQALTENVKHRDVCGYTNLAIIPVVNADLRRPVLAGWLLIQNNLSVIKVQHNVRPHLAHAITKTF